MPLMRSSTAQRGTGGEKKNTAVFFRYRNPRVHAGDDGDALLILLSLLLLLSRSKKDFIVVHQAEVLRSAQHATNTQKNKGAIEEEECAGDGGGGGAGNTYTLWRKRSCTLFFEMEQLQHLHQCRAATHMRVGKKEEQMQTCLNNTSTLSTSQGFASRRICQCCANALHIQRAKKREAFFFFPKRCSGRRRWPPTRIESRANNTHCATAAWLKMLPATSH